MAASKKTVLGRGLGALISDADTTTKNNDHTDEISIDKIDVNPFQPRTTFDEEALNELATSISELGVIQPITLRDMKNGRYQIISGERRTRAAKIAGLANIPAYVRTTDDQGMLEMALVENIQREDLDSIEIAISYNRLIEECDLTQEKLSERVGKKRSTIANYLRLLKLPAEIQKGIRNKKISMGHAKALGAIDTPEKQIEICLIIIENDLSVRKAEQIIKKYSNEISGQKKTSTNKDTQIVYDKLKDHLSNYFNTPIEFKRAKNGKGKIIIPFISDDDLERIIGILDKLNK